jgi:hypothetical protein
MSDPYEPHVTGDGTVHTEAVVFPPVMTTMCRADGNNIERRCTKLGAEELLS